MSIWVILTPIIAWLTAGLLGWSILRTPVDRMWHNIQLTTARTPYDPEQHRGFAGAVTFFGRFLLLIPIFRNFDEPAGHRRLDLTR